MQKRSPRILLAALAAGTTAFAVFRVLAAPPVTEPPSQSTQSTKDASAPILLAQAATPPQIGAVGGGSAGAGSEIAPEHADWKLVWQDDFNKDNGKIDPLKWSQVVKGGGFGNNEAEYYTDDPKNSHIEKDGADDVLAMIALREDKGGEHYTSAKLWTKGLYSFEYGRAEACIKVPSAQAGNWPAFWLMPDEPSPYGGWPGCGEIDILEMVNDAKTCYGTIHYGKTWRDKIGSQAVAPNGDFSTDYHVYGIEWDKDQFRFYIDHKPYGKVDGKDASGKPTWYTPNHDYPAPFNQKFYLILNFALGGDWPNNVVTPKRSLPDADGKFPQTMKVKYVRVYQPAQ
ncbi:MAG TPA: glycoside hydrolase family 16 protein [Chthoniobacteraceae bacterium]|nr:glycoside hydrolase family 16 protein [Chthoniobacteraceae bacterium]